MYGSIIECMYGRMNKCIDVRMMDEWMNVWMDIGMNVCMAVWKMEG